MLIKAGEIKHNGHVQAVTNQNALTKQTVNSLIAQQIKKPATASPALINSRSLALIQRLAFQINLQAF